MEKPAKPVNGVKSRTYDVRYNSTPIIECHANLEEAISFAYNLHRSTLSTKHQIQVRRHGPEADNLFTPYCTLCTEDYYNHLEVKEDGKDPLDSDDLPEYWQGHDGE